MYCKKSPLPRIVRRRDFLRYYVSAFTGATLLLPPEISRQQGPEHSRNGDYSSVVATVRQMLPLAMVRKEIPGASIALIDGERTIWAEGFGYTDRSKKLKITPDTPFFVGSISKSFTTLGVLKAVESGLLSLDQPLKEYLPWFMVNSRFGKPEADKITIRHLLSHHSGLGTWPPLGNPYDSQYHARAFEEVVKSTRDSWLKFPPGERFEYCNQGIDLAGYALQVAAGKSFAEFMRDEILGPLGMTASTFAQRDVTEKGVFASSYQGTRPVAIQNGIIHPMLAAGGLMSSARDMARFILFHLQDGKVNDKRLIQPNLLREMYSPQFTARTEPTGYGLGVYRAFEHDTERFSHGGYGYGVSTHYRWLPEQKIGIVLLTNQGASHNAPAFAGEIMKLMLKAKLGSVPANRPLARANRPRVSTDESALRRLEGTYLLYDAILYRFKVENGKLFQLAGKDKVQLEAHSQTEFTHGSRTYEFFLDEKGKAKGVRITDPYYDPSSAENSVTYLPINDAHGEEEGANKREWRQFVGKYAGSFIGESTEATVSIKNGHLYLNNELKLTQQDASLFFTADGEAVIFDKGGLVAGSRPFVKKQG